MMNSKTIIFSILFVLVLFTGIVLILDIDFARWFTCTGPFANPQDKASEVCKRLENAP
ncbi:hypothetical protein V0288_13700 [Pannus brasiliensis CCIBt3594]|uniref:Uncharacterized protein n=1 Tax=Pannus brasiliensis CCIBt3594 TaxID=1427578 RepID=A0AAW9QM83_9CHRO